MNEEDYNHLKIFEVVLFIVTLFAICTQILKHYYLEYETINLFATLLLAAMTIIWLVLAKNKELNNFELVLFIFVVISGGFILIFSLFLLVGLTLTLTTGAGGLLALFVLMMAYWSYRVIKNSRSASKKKRKFYKSDLIVIAIVIIIIAAIVVSYLAL